MSKQLKKYFKDIADKLRNNGLIMSGEGTLPELPISEPAEFATYCNDKFIATYYGGNTYVYSEDGINWTTSEFPSSGRWICVAYGNGKYVAIKSNHTGQGEVVYSDDGINWTESGVTLQYAHWRYIAYGNGKFVITPEHMANDYYSLIYSSDGINWTYLSSSKSGTVGGPVAYGDGKFVILSRYFDRVQYSVDAVNWTISELQSHEWLGITYGNGMFVAIAGHDSVTEGGEYLNKAFYSEDGITWNDVLLPESTQHYLAHIFFCNDRFVIIRGGGVSYNPGTALYSYDGINWVEIEIPHSIGSVGSVAYGDDKFLFISSGFFIYSRDGFTWDDKIKADDFPKRILELADMRKKKPGPIPIPSNNDLVMHFNGTISDATGNTAFTEVPAYISVASDKSKFGNGSLRCYSASGNQITGLRTTKKYNVGTKDFTIDFWFYYDNPPMYSTHPGYYTVIEFFGDNKDDGCAIYETHNSCKAIIGDISSLGYDYTSPAESGLPAGQWNHIALVRHNGVARLYFNGQQYHNNNSTQYGGYSSTHWPQDGNLPFSDDLGEVGIEISQQMASTVRPNFYIDELRVKIGEAVWTSDFTPPTAPYN